MAEPSKDTIYIDIDDEITGIIDKLRDSKGKIVALVLPKRAAVFQSIVNMKLLKRAADDSKKHLVLITSEAGLLPLAGAAGVHVAKTLTSKPEIPQPPVADDGSEEMVDESDEPSEVTAATAGGKAVGDLAGLPAATPSDGVETLELDDEDEAPEEVDAAVGASAAAVAARAAKKDKKLHVPNFERFRLLLVLGGVLLIALIVGLFIAMKVLPKASINVHTDATNINVNLNLTADSTVNSFDPAAHVLPAKLVTQQKTYTQQAPATGQQNNGTKAGGKVTLSLKDCSQPQVTIPAGTGVSANGLTYITQQSATLSSVSIGSQCKNSSFPSYSSATVDVVAQIAGSKYNADATSYTVAGFSDVSGDGTAMTGGTDNIVQVVSQSDIDNAKSKISTDDSSVKQALQDQLASSGEYAIIATYSAGTPNVTTSNNAGDQASSVTVTEQVTYTMLGVSQSDLKSLVDAAVKTQIDTTKQSILSDGLDAAVFNVNNNSGKTAQLSMQTVAIAGPQLSVADLKKQAAGKKPGDVKSQLTSNPDVTSVDIKLSPFWVTSVPTNTSKITVTIAKPSVTKTSNSTNANP